MSLGENIDLDVGGLAGVAAVQALAQGALKVQRACDVCRRKKIRCDGGRMPRNRCSNCIAYRFECTYVEAAKKRGPPKGYIESLESRLRKIEQLLSRICTEDDVASKQYDTHLDSSANSWPAQAAEHGSSLAGRPTTTSTTSSTSEVAARDSRSPVDAPSSSSMPSANAGADNNKTKSTAIATTSTSSGAIVADKMQDRFFGNSSSAKLIESAMDLKKKYTGSDAGSHSSLTSPLLAEEPKLWDTSPRDLPLEMSQPFTFPEQDLMDLLADLYFTQVNVFLPLLHRPTFEKFVADGLHLTDSIFGETLLLVCAVGCLYSNDPRIFLDGSDLTHSAGWKWFMQVEIVKTRTMEPPTVYDLQRCVLTALFLESSSAPQSSWTIIGIGIRLAQDVGAHRKKASSRPTVHDELWKRAFWVLFCLDRSASLALGRPCAIQDEDFDVELPIECDDEYWEHPDPAQAFKQPPNKPSNVAYFNSMLKLCQVSSFMFRTVYSIETSKISLGFVGQQWEQHIVAELDSALNKWIDTVPDHLRWEPSHDNELFYDQSVLLYATYYNLQISIHRPFIPPPRKPSPMISFPSVAICTNAARACSHVVDVTKRKSGRRMPQLQVAAFTAGIVLIMNIWGGKRSGISVDPTKEMSDVHKCMGVLKACEDRWLCTGRTWDLLHELARMGDLPLPSPGPSFTNKRERDSDDPISVSLAVPLSGSPIAERPRAMAGSRRVLSKSTSIRRHPDAMPSIPMHSDELGRMSLLGSAPFSSHLPPSSSSMNLHSGAWLSARDDGMANRAYNVGSATTSEMGGAAPNVFSFDPLYQDRTPMTFSRMFGSTDQPSGGGSQYQYREAPGLSASMAGRVALDTSSSSSHRGLNPLSTVSPGMVQNGAMAIWSQAPTGFELDDWSAYLTNLSEMTPGVQPVTDSLSGESW